MLLRTPMIPLALALSVLTLSISVLFLSINPTIVDAIAYRIKWVRND